MGLGDLANKVFNSSPADVVGGIKDATTSAAGAFHDANVGALGALKDSAFKPIQPALDFAQASGAQTHDLLSHSPTEYPGLAFNASPKEALGAIPQVQGISAMLNPMQFGGGQ